MALRRSFNLFAKKSNTRSIYSCSHHADFEQYAKDHGHFERVFDHHHHHHDAHHPHHFHSERFFHSEVRREVVEQAHQVQINSETETLAMPKNK